MAVSAAVKSSTEGDIHHTSMTLQYTGIVSEVSLVQMPLLPMVHLYVYSDPLIVMIQTKTYRLIDVLGLLSRWLDGRKRHFGTSKESNHLIDLKPTQHLGGDDCNSYSK